MCLLPHTRGVWQRSSCLTGRVHLIPEGFKGIRTTVKRSRIWNRVAACKLLHTQDSTRLPKVGTAHRLDQNAITIPKQPLTSYGGHSTFGF